MTQLGFPWAPPSSPPALSAAFVLYVLGAAVILGLRGLPMAFDFHRLQLEFQFAPLTGEV